MIKTDSIKPEKKDVIAACLTVAAAQMLTNSSDEEAAVQKALSLFAQIRTALDPGHVIGQEAQS